MESCSTLHGIDYGECNVGNPVNPHNNFAIWLVSIGKNPTNMGKHGIGLTTNRRVRAKPTFGFKLAISTDVLFLP